MTRLPATGMHHSIAAMWFALDCLLHAIAHPQRKAPR